jgi:OmpA-OmpF porin, OOP family
MAVSQYLRSESLVDMVKSYLTSDVVHHASSLVGESESSTFHAMHGAVPGLLGGLLNFSSNREGASSLAGMVRDGRYGAVLDNPGSLFGGGSVTSNMTSIGQSLTGKIFGNKASSVKDALASSSGVKATSAGTLMSLLAPLTLGVLGKLGGSQGLDATGISNLLQGQRSDIASATSPEMSRVLGLARGPVAAPTPVAPTPSALYEERAESSSLRWLPLLLVGLAALGLLLWALSRGRGTAERVANTATTTAEQAANTATNAVSNLNLPGGNSIAVPQGSINYNLAQYLGSGSQDVPKTFVFDHLNFEPASTQLTQGSDTTVNNLAAVLNAYPNAQVQLSGYTDNTGSAQTNQQLSLDRANAVKAMLVGHGVNAGRITTMGFGQDHPLTSNDSEEGRAQNRRTELTVTRK